MTKLVNGVANKKLVPVDVVALMDFWMLLQREIDKSVTLKIHLLLTEKMNPSWHFIWASHKITSARLLIHSLTSLFSIQWGPFCHPSPGSLFSGIYLGNVSQGYPSICLIQQFDSPIVLSRLYCLSFPVKASPTLWHYLFLTLEGEPAHLFPPFVSSLLSTISLSPSISEFIGFVYPFPW